MTMIKLDAVRLDDLNIFKIDKLTHEEFLLIVLTFRKEVKGVLTEAEACKKFLEWRATSEHNDVDKNLSIWEHMNALYPYTN